MRHSYRVVKCPGYFTLHEAQVRRWWWPFWTVIGDGHSAKEAESLCHAHANPVVKYLGKLP